MRGIFAFSLHGGLRTNPARFRCYSMPAAEATRNYSSAKHRYLNNLPASHAQARHTFPGFDGRPGLSCALAGRRILRVRILPVSLLAHSPRLLRRRRFACQVAAPASVSVPGSPAWPCTRARHQAWPRGPLRSSGASTQSPRCEHLPAPGARSRLLRAIQRH